MAIVINPKMDLASTTRSLWVRRILEEKRLAVFERSAHGRAWSPSLLVTVNWFLDVTQSCDQGRQTHSS